MRRTLIVHIGAPKAGSTSLQGMLHRLSGPLGRLGVHVPSSGRGGGAHTDLSYVYPGSPLHGRSHRAWAALRDELRRHRSPRFVISSETFSLCAADHVASRVSELAETVGLDVEVVAYVRPQYQALEAGYAESVKMGLHAAGFGTILEQLADWPLDYAAAFRPWRDRFGGRVKVHPIEPCRMPDGLLAHFLGLLGAGELTREAVAAPRQNPRLGAKLVEVLRLATAALDERMIDTPRKRSILKLLLRRVSPLLDGDLPFAGLSPAQVREITDRFAASNARFANEYGIDAGGVLFRDPPEDGLTRPARATWEADFSEEERVGVRRVVRSAAGVDLPSGAGEAGRRSGSVWRRGLQRRQTRAASVRGNDWRRLAQTEPREFTPLWPVSVVVSGPVAPESLGRTLAAMGRQTYPQDLVEVVIADASPPGSWARPAPGATAVRRIRCPDGQPGARNAGAQAAAHDILLFLDAGLAPEPGWLAGHAQWHHRVSDVVTVDRPVVSGAGPASPGEWAGALSGAPFGIGRRFFELAGGFDAALARREWQDVEFGRRVRTCGGLLVPAGAAAVCARQVRARVAETDAGADGLDGVAPRWLVVLEVLPGGDEAAVEAIERLLAEGGSSVAVLVDTGGAAAADGRLRERVGEDARLRWGPAADAGHIRRAAPLQVRTPARDAGIGGLLERLEAELGDAAAGAAVLADGTRLSVARTWALHRARRTGRDLSAFGRVVTIGARRLQPGVLPVLTDFWHVVSRTGQAARRSAAGIHADRRDNRLRWFMRDLRRVAGRVRRRLRGRVA